MFSVIFDMDGTLLDTQRICIPAWEYAGRLQGISNMGNCIYEVCGMNENGWTNYLKTHFEGLDIPLFKKEMREYIIKNGVVRFKSGAKELLQFLKSNKIKIALASSSSRGSIDHHLAKVKVAHYFDAIVSGREVENGKPSPDIFLKTAKLIGAEPNTCFVFEDSANGIRAGYTAGMKCIGIPDIIPFDEDIKKLMFAELRSLSEAINIFENILYI